MKGILKAITCVVVVIFLLLTVLPLMPAGTEPVSAAPPAKDEGSQSQSSCVNISLALSAQNTMPVPAACTNGICKLVLYTDAIMGAFSDGYSWEVYYRQFSDDTWIGGPNISLGGVSFSEGYGTNGDNISRGVFLWGETTDGGYIRIMDDGNGESNPDLWTIESKASKELTQASLHVCEMSGYQWQNVSSDSTIDMPSFCEDAVCMILRFSYASFGAFGPGLSLPVYYNQNSSTDEWIGGPNIAIEGVLFSAGQGKNDTGISAIFDGGTTERGGYAVLLDDWVEWSNTQWSVDFYGSPDLSLVRYYIIPMTCQKQTASIGSTNFTVPGYCVDAMCTLLRWTDAWFGAWGPGLSWPVSFKQNSLNHSWIGGPALCVGGQCFSSGKGLNGDASAEIVFDSGRTTHDGYVILRDDSVSASELDPGKWNVVLKPMDDLTSASYYICSNTCQETIFMINKQYLPMMVK